MGIHFDMLAGLFQTCEHLKPLQCGDLPWRVIAQRAALFDLKIDADRPSLMLLQGRTESGYDAQTIAFLTDNFFLPFPDVVIEDRQGCVIASDTREEQRGLAECCHFLGFRSLEGRMAFGVPALGLITTGDSRFIIHGQGPQSWWEALPSELNLHSILIIDDDTSSFLPPLLTRNIFGSDIMTCLDEIITINTPNRFVFRDAPINVDQLQRQWRRRVLPTHQRPKFTMLTPAQIKTRLHPDAPRPPHNGEHHHKTPHFRRRHERNLRSDFYKNKQGSRIIIPAMWIGDDHAQRGDRDYRVMLDR